MGRYGAIAVCPMCYSAHSVLFMDLYAKCLTAVEEHWGG